MREEQEFMLPANPAVTGGVWGAMRMKVVSPKEGWNGWWNCEVVEDRSGCDYEPGTEIAVHFSQIQEGTFAGEMTGDQDYL